MQNTFIQFDITANGDLFSPLRKLSYKVVTDKPKVEGQYNDNVDIEAIQYKVTKREMLACMQRMLGVRSNPYVLGLLPTEVRKELPKVERCINLAATMSTPTTFYIYVRESVLPLLYAIKPGQKSNKRANYMQRYDALVNICDSVMEFIDHKPKLILSELGNFDF